MSDEIKDKYAEKWAKDDAQREELHAAQVAEFTSIRESRAAAREHDALSLERNAAELENVWEQPGSESQRRSRSWYRNERSSL